MATRHEHDRPRSKSMMSFHSHRSTKSDGSGPKIDLTETSAEKASRRIHTKADPSLAITELQPSTIAMQKATLESLRNMQHRDAQGNVITDPDRSNPTRPRLERPLDTIRSFHAAIDGSYGRRPQTTRAETYDTAGQSRRSSSYFSGYNNGGHAQPQRGAGPGESVAYGGVGYSGYYDGNNPRANGSRPDSYIDNYAGAPSNPYQGRGGRANNQRMASDPAMYGNNSQKVYPSHGYQQSYDTVTTGSVSGSHGTDQWGNSTDPSSENSSFDRLNHVPPVQKPDVGEQYGFSGFGGGPQFQGPILEEYAQDAPEYGQPGYGQSGYNQPRMAPGNGHPYQGNGDVPAPPPHVVSTSPPPRAPIRLGNSSSPAGASYSSPPDSGDKRKSWLKRRFSKNN